MFELGQRICLKNNPEKRGVIQGGPFLVNGYNVFQVMFDDNTQGNESEINLQFEIVAKSPWDKLANNLFGNHQNYSIVSTVSKIQNASANTISTLKASKTLFRPYQFIPLVKMLNSYNRRILIADEVGLGKTIAAGHILLEFMARGEVNNLLIICPNDLKLKWVDEMENRFNVRLKNYDSTDEFKKDIVDLRERGQTIFGVVNYEKFRNKKDLEFFQENATSFDLIIFDEAQRLRNSKAKNKKDPNMAIAIRNLTPLAKAIVMLSATPIMTSLENLYNLITILDEKEYSGYEVFQNNININKPLIKAFKQTNDLQLSFNQIVSELENAKVESVFKYGEYESTESLPLSNILNEDALYHSVVEDLNNLEDSLKNRALIRQKLVGLNSLNHIYSRTRKKEVLEKDEFVNRNVHAPTIEMTDEEREIYRDVVFNNYGFGGMMTKRNYASSLFAAQYQEAELNNPSFDFNNNDSKYSALKDILTNANDKVIVFSYFRRTLFYLKNRLENDGYQIGIMYGGINLNERNEIIKSFKNSEFEILLTTEVGSTGLDMQFCDTLVNYDLPWNPMTVEQRIGRIDRIGQQSEVINIFNLIYEGTIEEKIYRKLYDRINVFEESLGDLDDILGEREKYIEGLIEELYQTRLSDEQIEMKLDNLRNAIENNRINQQTIREGLRDSFSNDYYFKEQINDIEEKGRFLTSNELIELVNLIVVHKLKTMIFMQIGDSLVYRIKQDKVNQLFRFIEEHYDQDKGELQKIHNAFKTKNQDNLEIDLTFDQEYAFNNKKVEFISSYHPLINAIANYFKNKGIGQNEVFKFGINRNYFSSERTFSNGHYILINYSLKIEKTLFGKSTHSLLIKSLAIDLEKDEDFILDEDKAEILNSVAQKHRQSIQLDDSDIFNEDFRRVIEQIYVENSFTTKSKLEEEEKLKFNSEIQRKKSQEKANLEKRIDRIQYNLDNGIGLPGPQRSEIKSLEEKIENFEVESKKSTISVSDSLISINLIQIYG